MSGYLLVGECRQPGLGRPVVELAHADADAGQVVDEEIDPVIGGDFNEHVRPGRHDAPSQLRERGRKTLLPPGSDRRPIAHDQRPVARRVDPDELCHRYTLPKAKNESATETHGSTQTVKSEVANRRSKRISNLPFCPCFPCDSVANLAFGFIRVYLRSSAAHAFPTRRWSRKRGSCSRNPPPPCRTRGSRISEGTDSRAWRRKRHRRARRRPVLRA